jgi:transposase
MDRDGVKLLLTPAVRARFPHLHIWVDSAYNGQDKGQNWIKQTLGWSVAMVKRPTKPRGIWLPNDTPPEAIDWSKYLPPPGFHVLPRRWVIERTFGWLSQNRRLSKDYERLCATEEALIYLAMVRLMLRRLAPP